MIREDVGADDTDLVQDAIDLYSRQVRTGTIPLSARTYTIRRTLVYTGNPSYSFRFEGDQAGPGPSGTVLKWAGEPGGVMLDLRGARHTFVARIAFDGRGIAGTGVRVSRDRSGWGAGSSGVTLERLTLQGFRGPDSACINLGYGDDDQIDGVRIEKCELNGLLPGGGREPDGELTRFGIVTGTANSCDFLIRDCGITHCQIGVRHGGGGYCLVQSSQGGGATEADFAVGTGVFLAEACRWEHSTRLLTGTTGANAGTAILRGVQWDGEPPPDGVVVIYSGFLRLEGSQLRDITGGGRVPKVALAVGSSPGILISEGTFYRHATGRAPFVDGGGLNDLWGPLYADGKYVRVRSFGDYGGIEGNLVRLDSGSIG